MEYRQATPPSAITIHDYDSMQCPSGSASTTATSAFFPDNWSPESVNTAASSPPKTPPGLPRDAPGNWLLPKPREQDQPAGYIGRASAFHGHHGHTRTFSCPGDVFQMQYGTSLLPPAPIHRRSISPPRYELCLNVPAAQPMYKPVQIEAYEPQQRPALAGARSHSTSNIRTHSRGSSSSSIDAVQLMRHGYPYRSSPTPQPVGVPLSRTPSAMSHLAPIVMPGGQMQSYPNNRRASSPPAKRARAAMDARLISDVEIPTSTVLEYLTAPNPTLSLVKRLTEGGIGQNTHFWYDIRNVKSWTDFNIATMTAMPNLLDLLNFPIPTNKLPCPVRSNQTPETLSQLAEICARHHAVKVNAALKIAQGADKHITIRTLTAPAAAPAARQQPEFVANYQSEGAQTIYGNGLGRVVGIVKGFEQWSSSMRASGSPVEKVTYLRHLAHLHRFMREHGTRYGFIMTEIELVCVRAGGPPSEDQVPLFGYLEVAPAVQVSAAGKEEGGKLKMTAGLALWYLHMLAKEQPFPGQYHWKMEVGPPGALSRQRHLPRDADLPKPGTPEKREAKRIRGWVWPDEPLSKREVGKKARTRTK